MIHLILNILFAVLAVIIYWQAPEEYSPAFCQTILGLYLLQNAMWLALVGKQRRLRFELMFMISFLFANFIYPSCYAEWYPHWYFFDRPFNRHIINQATAMAYLSYTCYMLGVTSTPWNKRPEPTHPKWKITPIHMRCLSTIALVSFALFVVLGGYTMLTNVYSRGGDLKEVGVFSYFYNIFCIAALAMSALVFHLESKRRWVYLSILILFVLILLSTGSRSFSLSVTLILMVSFSLYVRRLRAWQVILALLVGSGALYAIVQWRSSYDSASVDGFSAMAFLDVFSDLTINNLNLYVLTEWGNTHELRWLHGMIVDLLSPIPKLGSIVLANSTEPPELITGGDLPSYLILGRNAGWGIGTNMVGEGYTAFGLVGLCVAMFGTGVFIRESYYRGAKSIYWYVLYMIIVGQAVMWPRAPFFLNPRTVVWCMMLLWGIMHYAKCRVQKRERRVESRECKVVYCIPSLYRAGGMERVLTEKVNWLVAHHEDIRITIVTTETVPNGEKKSYYRLDERVRVIELDINFDEDFKKNIVCKWWSRQHKQRRYERALTELLRREQADVCLSMGGKEIEWLGQADVDCRKIVEMHFAMDYRARLLSQYHKGRIWTLVGRLMTRELVRNVRRMDELVVLTRADGDNWRKAGVEHVRCIINPCSLSPSNEGKHEKKQVLAVGRLHPQKGFDMLLRAWQRVTTVCHDWTLCIAGEGELRDELTQQAKALGIADSVKMEGLSQDIRKDYQESGLFVLSSRWEGLGLVLMEAMSQGCCSVAFDCEQGPNELIEDGVSGVLVKAGDEEALAETIVTLIKDEEKRRFMGEKAYEQAVERFGIDAVMKNWEFLKVQSAEYKVQNVEGC